MKRFSTSIYDRFYNEGRDYRFIPTLRREVVPGQSIEGTMEVAFRTLPFTKSVMTDAIVDHWIFYVPHRIVWDEFVDFVSQDADSTATLPTTTTTWAIVGDKAGTHSALYRRAYKACLNAYLLEPDQSSVVTPMTAYEPYEDITDDTDTTQKAALNPDQLTRATGLNAEYDAPTYDATTTPIDLVDFNYAMKRALAQRHAQSSGDRYVDMLYAMGVKADWRIRLEPELLHRTGKTIRPVSIASTESATLGNLVSRYEGQIKVNLPRKMFAEHGYLVGIACLRPHVLNASQDKTPDSFTHTTNEPLKSFFLGNNEEQVMTINTDLLTTGTGTDSGRRLRFAHIMHGCNIVGYDAIIGDYIGQTPADFKELYHPQNTMPLATPGVGLAVYARSRFKAMLPMDRNRMVFGEERAGSLEADSQG